MVNAPLPDSVLGRLARNLAYWQQAKGYAFVDLPWVVSPEFTNATRPAWVTQEDPSTRYGNLLASGEQAFLALEQDNGLPAGFSGYVGWTPCFRDEGTFDRFHHFYFMKSEVFVPCTAANAQTELAAVIAAARQWFATELALLGLPENLLAVERISLEQQDLVLNGIEIGSYGIRPCAQGLYIYGTGCAEPRFSEAARFAG